MTRGSVAADIAGRLLPGAAPGAPPEISPEQPPVRCADAARMRGEPLTASAVRHRRFLLLEVPGPWGSSALDGKHMDGEVAGQLASAASAAGVHILLIRRPGRHPAVDQADSQRIMAWGLADTAPGAETVLWGSWRGPADLLSLDLTAEIDAKAQAAAPQRLALVCTNGKRDQCCAINGRPVAEAIATTGWDTWECSHLGGHRFAATILLLPTGDMFGRLDPTSALEVMRRFDAGQLVLPHYRGRAGQPAPVQAALHAAAVRLGDFRRSAVQVSSVCSVPGADDADSWEVEISHREERGPGTAYRMIVAGSRLAPAFLSCRDNSPKAEIRYAVLSFTRTK